MYLEDFNNALAYLNIIPDTTVNLSDFKTYYGILINVESNGRSIFELSDYEYNTIKLIADGDSSDIAPVAQTLLTLVKKGDYALNPQEDIGDTQPGKNVENEISIPPTMLIYPMPAGNKLTIEFSFGTTANKGEIQLVDILGMTIYSRTLSADENTIQIDSHNFPQGLYLCLLKQSDKILIQQKISIVR